VATFGGEQFVMPYQKKEMTMFFSLFYAAVNCGSLISVLLTPILRAETQCFGQESCYPLAFGVPAVLMCVAVSKLFLYFKWIIYVMSSITKRQTLTTF
jgi:solute carrier family 15 oligopeptide transporter 1